VDRDFECVVVGGGVAGLSAAMVLGRARRRTLVLDLSGQSNRAAAHVGGLLGHDGGISWNGSLPMTPPHWTSTLTTPTTRCSLT
jgi:thioredoxin reductase